MIDEQHAQVVQDNLALIDRNHDLELELDMCKKALGECERVADQLFTDAMHIEHSGQSWISTLTVKERMSDIKHACEDTYEIPKPEDMTTCSAYDLISEEDRETLRWVRDQGGLRPVQNEVSNYATLCRSIQDADNRRIEMCSILGIDVDTGWSDACEELRNRLIPESYEWPRYEDGDPVKLGDMALIDGELDMVEQVSLTIQHQPVIVGDGGSQQLARGERIKRPDSWERIEEDAKKDRCSYFGAKYQDCGRCTQLATSCSISKACDIVRRCKALAERGE